MSVFSEIQDIYFAVHTENGEVPTGRYATRKGQSEAIWDALLLLAARMDGDADRNPRAERGVHPDEFADPEKI